jgi:16S rRNA (cytosine967-C5)-methyltransferase
LGTAPPTSDKKRRHRGHPRAHTGAGRHSADGPTHARLIALRIIERVQRVQAFADLALHYSLAQSRLSGVDRALTTELVYGTLRWRGRLDYLLSKVLDRELDSLDAMVASTLRMGAYQLVFTDRIPDNAAVDQAVRCARAVGAERATGLVNAVLRRLAREHRQVVFPDLASDPLGHLTHALSLPPWLASRWLELFGP